MTAYQLDFFQMPCPYHIAHRVRPRREQTLLPFHVRYNAAPSTAARVALHLALAVEPVESSWNVLSSKYAVYGLYPLLPDPRSLP